MRDQSVAEATDYTLHFLIQKDAMLDAITVFLDYLPPNTTPADIEIKYAFKCADRSGGWAGLSGTKGSPEKWRQALKASTCEFGVFHISSMPAGHIKRVFPYSSQATDVTAMGETRTPYSNARRQISSADVP